MVDRIKGLANHWPVVLAILAAAVAWGTFTAQIGSLQDGNKAILSKLDKQSDQIANFQASVSATQATEAATTSNVDDLRARMRALEARR